MSDYLPSEKMFCPLCQHLKENSSADMCANCFTELGLEAVEMETLMDDDFDDGCSHEQ
jgi:hypothetical protein